MFVETEAEIAPFIKVLDSYDQCFFNRDIGSLRELYVSDGVVPFFDNHQDCDTAALSEHLSRVSTFFSQGTIVQLLREEIKIFVSGSGACITLVQRYSTEPNPGVRTSIFLELEGEMWKIRHIHHSFNPNEVV